MVINWQDIEQNLVRPIEGAKGQWLRPFPQIEPDVKVIRSLVDGKGLDFLNILFGYPRLQQL